MPSDPFDLSRARLSGPDYFKRYRAPDDGEPLANSGLGPEVELLVVERGGEERGFVSPRRTGPFGRGTLRRQLLRGLQFRRRSDASG